MPLREDLRNVAIVAHVDHGKTTLVDAMLWQSGAFRANQDVDERVMDSMDLEREKGITILAKNTAVRYGDVKINIVDTPGHADFGGEVERALTMVDGVLLLVDASEGPLPQTRFVLRKALESRLPVDPRREQGRPRRTRASPRSSTRSRSCSSTSTPTSTRSTSRSCTRTPATGPGGSGARRRSRPTSSRCSRRCSSTSPRPSTTRAHPLQALVTNLDASPYVGRLALCRVRHGTLRTRPGGRVVPRRRHDRAAKIAELYVTDALDRVDAEEAGPGEIIAVAGIAEITIGETLADPDDPRPLPGDPRRRAGLSMTVGINTSPLVGQDGDKLTARLVKTRLDQELVGNVSIRVLDTERPETVGGAGPRRAAARGPRGDDAARGLRAHGRQAAGRDAEVDGKLHEPMERVAIDVPEDYLGVVSQLLALRKGRMEQMVNHGTGWVRHGVPRAGARPDRVPHRVHDRDARDRAAPPRVRGLRAVARRAAHPAERLPGRRPPRRRRRSSRC